MVAVPAHSSRSATPPRGHLAGEGRASVGGLAASVGGLAALMRQSQDTGQRGQRPAPGPAATQPCGPRGGQRKEPKFLLGLLVWVLGPHLPKPQTDGLCRSLRLSWWGQGYPALLGMGSHLRSTSGCSWEASLTGRASLQGCLCQRSMTWSARPPHGWGRCGEHGTKARLTSRAVLELLQAQRKLPEYEGRMGPEADPPAGACVGASSDPKLCSPASAPPQGRGLMAGLGQWTDPGTRHRPVTSIDVDRESGSCRCPRGLVEGTCSPHVAPMWPATFPQGVGWLGTGPRNPQGGPQFPDAAAGAWV